jgi:hypothetical protein
MIADADDPRGIPSSNGYSRVERMVVVASVGHLGAMAGRHLLVPLPKYYLNGAAREGSAGG